jgi:hypothetical protein
MGKPKLSPEAKKFIQYGEVAYNNGPWDYEDAHAMSRHAAISSSLQKGGETPSCIFCGKTVVPMGRNNWKHIDTPASHVQDDGEKTTGGFSHEDTIDPEDHPPLLSKQFDNQ